jgi:hypothetical protein
VRPEYVERLPPEARDRARAFRRAVERFLGNLPEGFSNAADQLGVELAE